MRKALKEKLRKATASATGGGAGASVMVVKQQEFMQRDINFLGTVQIDGRVEGQVCGDRVLVTALATVDGSVEGKTVRVDGTVNGPINGETIILAPTARVKGNVTYKSLTIVSGASVFGLCRDLNRSAPGSYGKGGSDATEPIPFHRIKRSPKPKRLTSARPVHLPTAPQPTQSMKEVWHALHRARAMRPIATSVKSRP